MPTPERGLGRRSASGVRLAVLALATELSMAACLGLGSAIAKTTTTPGFAQTNAGQLAQSAAPAPNPELLRSRTEGDDVYAVGTGAPAELPAGEDQEPAAPAAVENSPPTEAAGAGHRWLWLLLGGLALAGCWGGWRFLGQGRSAKRSTASSERSPSADSLEKGSAEPSPAPDHAMATPCTVGHSETLAAPAVGAASPTAGAADSTLDATTRLTSGDIVDSLIHELSSRDGAVRRHAIWELGQRGHSEAIQPLINGLLDADSQEKSLILAALAEISSRSLKPMHRALALGLQDPSPEVRKNAIRDLSRIYDTVVQLSHMLAHATQDPDVGVQETAQWALSQLNRIPASAYPGTLPPEANSLDAAYDSDGQRLAPEGHRLPPSA